MRRFPSSILTLIALVLTGAQAPESIGAAKRYVISQSRGGLGIDVQEDAVLWRIGKNWIGERYHKSSNWCGDHRGGRCVATERDRHVRIDGRRCNALAAALDALPLAWTADPAAASGYGSMVTDAPLFTLHSFTDEKGRTAGRTIQEYFGPVEEWWESAERSTEQCWTYDSPMVRGRRIDSVIAHFDSR